MLFSVCCYGLVLFHSGLVLFLFCFICTKRGNTVSRKERKFPPVLSAGAGYQCAQYQFLCRGRQRSVGGSDEHVLSLQLSLSEIVVEHVAYGRLVAVRIGGVDVAIARVQHDGQHLPDLLAGHLQTTTTAQGGVWLASKQPDQQKPQ